jgi:glycosyltransferase involved in cell wall biosynthesis
MRLGSSSPADVALADGAAQQTLHGEDIVCVGFADWESQLWTNQHHLMSRLARHNRVLFIESLGLRRPQLVRTDLERIATRLHGMRAGVRAIDDLHVLSPPVVPLHGSAAIRSINRRLLPWAVGRAMGRLGMREPILWSYAPQAEVLLEPVQPSLVVYHCVDDVAAHKGVDSRGFRAAEDRFARRADLVLASARPLADRLRTMRDDVLTAPNVADVDLFGTALDPGRIDPALAALPEPRIVFVGAVVATKLDLDLLTRLARARRDWSFVLVGPVGTGDPSTDASALDSEPNVYMLGFRPYAELPAVLRGADVGLIPYALNDLTASVFPMKVYEYLAAGLPIVATRLPSLEGQPGVAFGDGPDAMVEEIDRALRGRGGRAREERARLAVGHSWDARLAEIARAVEATRQRR